MAPISDLAYQNKAVIYDFLFKASAETLVTIAADPCSGSQPSFPMSACGCRTLLPAGS